MCVYSMVHDHYLPQFPNPFSPLNPKDSTAPSWPATNVSSWPTIDLDRLAKLVAEFKEAAEAAQKIDKLTKQPDCVDPEKEKMSKRIFELEAQLAAALAKPVKVVAKPKKKQTKKK